MRGHFHHQCLDQITTVGSRRYVATRTARLRPRRQSKGALAWPMRNSSRGRAGTLRRSSGGACGCLQFVGASGRPGTGGTSPTRRSGLIWVHDRGPPDVGGVVSAHVSAVCPDVPRRTACRPVVVPRGDFQPATPRLSVTGKHRLVAGAVDALNQLVGWRRSGASRSSMRPSGSDRPKRLSPGRPRP